MITNPSFSTIIKTYFDQKRIRKSALARKMNINVKTLNFVSEHKTIKAQLLWDLSVALEHNFFHDIASMLPTEYLASQPHNGNLNTKILQLEQKILILEAEKELLLKVLQK
jgi:hypothetical protein